MFTGMDLKVKYITVNKVEMSLTILRNWILTQGKLFNMSVSMS
jgi:hypothetical protein